MKQITKRQLDRQASIAKLREWMPFELISDGEVIALVTLPHIDSQAKELPLSKTKQAKHTW